MRKQGCRAQAHVYLAGCRGSIVFQVGALALGGQLLLTVEGV